MRKAVFLLLALAVLGAMGSQYWADEFNRDSQFDRYWPRMPNDPFGKRIAGVFIGSFDFLGNVSPFIQTYNEDGTAQTSGTHPNASVHHVAWEQTGTYEVAWRLLHFNFNDNGLSFISRTSGTQTYDRDYESFVGEFTIEACPCVCEEEIDGEMVPCGIPPGPACVCDCTDLITALEADANDPTVCVIPPLPPGSTQGRRLEVDLP
jgi:hypothetical protein